MATRRTAKAARAIREIVSTAVLMKLNDPRIKNVTILGVEVAGDMRSAKVYASVLGDKKVQELSMHGLNSSKGYIQKLIADQLTTRYTPVLTFVLDSSVKRSIQTAQILKQLGEDQSEVEEEEEEELPEDSSSVPPTEPADEQE